ncbi:zinc finger CCCH domain-containing protein 39 [Euphorbia lathyris]|uniref:zinc finger CCCH domain-containing protein 39 n=1 Tax=Euphorbia lathyris TaxID=212925 RepID=UPI0033138C88
MSYTDSRPFMSPQPSYQSGSDAIGIWPQFPMNEQFDSLSQIENHQPPFKRPRNSDDSNQSICSRTPLPNLPINKGTTNIFFKTRMCAKYRTGNCRNGENCNFAHGLQDLRQPPPNWQDIVGVGANARGEEDRPLGNWDDDQIILKWSLCKKFNNGEECPYGNKCTFRHQDSAKFRDEMGKFRESSAISIGTTGQPIMHGNIVLNAVETNKPVNNSISDSFRANLKPVYWKTKLCVKWDTTGQCPFGDKCHFAHGQAELQVHVGRAEGEAGNSTSSVLTKPTPSAINGTQNMSANVPILIGEGRSKKCLLKLKGPKKINRIYGDWLDDLPLVQNFTSQVES